MNSLRSKTSLSRSSSASRIDRLQNNVKSHRSGTGSVKSQIFPLNLSSKTSSSIITFRDPSTITTGERKDRIKSIIVEIEKEKPLCEKVLYQMSFTPRSLVWSSAVDSLYGPQMQVVQTKVEKPETPASQVSQKDFVKLNALSANRGPVKLKASKMKTETPTATARNHKLGIVPKYLTDRKNQWKMEEERKIREQPDPDCPPGHFPMPESERLETLTDLKSSYEEIIQELNSLPVSRDTLRIRQKRQDLEKQLEKVEEGIAILSKPKVFVKIDS